MDQTFTISSDERVVDLVTTARTRLVIVAPALSTAVAEAIAGRMGDLPELSLTVVLDADPEVYRMGYGEVAALETIRRAAADASFRLREQPGVRIGLVISDDRTLIFAPVSANIEAGSTSEDKPNAIMLDGPATDGLARKAGAPSACAPDAPPEAEIGRSSLSVERVAETQENLRRTPPLPVDLTRKLRVFMSRVQYVELKVKGYQLGRRRAKLPEDFIDVASPELKRRVSGGIRTPIDGIGKIEVGIEWAGKSEILSVDGKFLDQERSEIEKALTYVMPKRGRMILRQHRDDFNAQIKRFEAIVAAYQKALAAKLDEARSDFCNEFVEEFLPKWKKNRPKLYFRRLAEPTEEELRRDIMVRADRLFDEIVKLEPPDISVVYKDIAIEDLEDQNFLQALREIMARGGVSKADLDTLFESGAAAPEQGSFAGMGGAPA